MSIKLGEICKFQSGGTPAKGKAEYFNGQIPWITTTALTGGFIDETDAVDWITDKAIKETAAKIVPANSIMVGTRVGVGKVAINKVDMSTSQDIISLLDIDEQVWDKNYLCKFIQGKSSYLNSQARGATIKGIKIDVLSSLQIPDVTIQDQRHIASIIDAVTTIIKERNSELIMLDELIKARFVEMFGTPFETSNWDVKELKDLSESMVDGSNVNPGYYESEGDVLFLRIQNVWRNEFRLDDSVYITSEVNKQNYYDTSLKNGDLLITKIGRYYTKDSSLGRVSVYLGEDDRANYSNNIMRVRLIDSMNSEFVNVLLNLDEYQSFIKRTSKGGTDKRALSKSLIGSYPIIAPPRALQDSFVEFVKLVDKSKVAVQKALDEAQLLFDSLMQEYFG